MGKERKRGRLGEDNLVAAPFGAPLKQQVSAKEEGDCRTYWNDFVFEGYVNYRTEAIFLAGLPDVPESRPHSAVNN